jgi:polygalacturonase
MTRAHAALLNAGRCVRIKDPLVGWDDCAEWTTVQNLVISGGGEINGNGDQWWTQCTPQCPDGTDTNQRPTLFGLLWVDGLTISGMVIRRPAFWTIHPTFSNNVRIVGNDIFTNGHGTDGCDPDSCWNVYISNNSFSTRDDCIALKAGKDWSGRMVNISTENVMIEKNVFVAGHGIAFGSETSGWVRSVVVRNLELSAVEAVVRMKSMRGRGGGIEHVLYENITGSVQQAIQITLNYKKNAKPTNASATPIIRNVTIRNVNVAATESTILCDGLPDSVIQNLTVDNLTVVGAGGGAPSKRLQKCEHCTGEQEDTHPKLCIKQ